LTIANSHATKDDLSSANATSNAVNENPSETSNINNNAIPPIDDLLWNNINALHQANIPTPRTQTTAAPITSTPSHIDLNGTRVNEQNVNTVQNSSESVFYEPELTDLPVYNSMSEILDDFLRAHNNKDILQACLKQAELNHSMEINHCELNTKHRINPY
jgi:hypothetical protein